jgi:hypothetical protein
MKIKTFSIAEQFREEGYAIVRQLFDNLEPYYDDTEWYL